MQVNRVSPSQPEKNIGQAPVSPGDQVGKTTYKQQVVEQRPKLEPAATRETTKWIECDFNAKASLCSKESQEKNMCHCGKKQEKHASNLENQHNKSDTEPTNYFGKITFDINHTAKYIRVHSNTAKPKTVLKLMKEKWKLEKPDLLISVYGSMNSLAETCQTSLTKAVQGTGTWIITDGEHKYVNTDEKADEQPIVIGISQSVGVHNTHQMDTQQRTRSAEYYPENNSLDPHHSHFILIDNGSGDISSTTSNFREELESEITKSESDNGVPIVLLVFQGDDDIKRTVYDAAVVIVKESDKKASGNEAKSEIPKNISNSKYTHVCSWNVDSCESDLGLAILQALSKAAKENRSDKMTDHVYQLKLADAWNIFGTAKNISIDTRRQDDILTSCMMAAILLDKVEYVTKILDNDFDLKAFLTDEKLKELYNAQFEGSLFNDVLPKMTKPLDKDKKKNVWMHVERLLNHVRESKPQLRYLDDNIMVENCCTKTCCTKEGCCCLRIACCTSRENRKSSDQQDAKKQTIDEHPWLDLFVWSVLNNRQDMAKLFRQRGKDAMAAALFAHALLSAMSHQIDDRDFKEKCKKHRCEFTNLAIGILKEGYKEGGVNLAKKLLTQGHEQWGNTSCVLIAVNANNKQFISEQACQDVFNNIWMGNIKQETGILCNNLKLLLCIFFPLLILFWVTFREEDTKHSDPGQTDSDLNSNQEDQENEYKNTDSSEQREEPTIWNKIKYFYQAPVIICFHNVISYMLFLGLYSYVLMTKFDRYLSWLEILLCVWVFTIFIHELIQVRLTPAKGWKRKLSNYIKDGWNILDIVTLGFFLIGMILRIFDNKQVAESAHVVHGVNLITFYLRLLHIFSVHRKLGPKLVMIIHMVYNIAYFFMILVVFIVAYGIASHSILYPHTEPSFETFTEIFRRPYWNIYGELMLDKFEGSADCTNDPELYKTGTYSRCPTESGKYFVPLLLGVYMLMCNILLLNLLIAMFGFTFQKVQENSYLYWSFQQYSLINEYANRPFLVPPLIIFAHLYHLIQWIRSCCKKKSCKCNDDKSTVFCRSDVALCKKDNKTVEAFYKNGMRMEHNSSNVSDADSTNLDKRMEQMEKQLNRLVQKQNEILEKLESSKVLSR